VSKSPRLVAATVAATVGIVLTPAAPAMASPFGHHDRGPSNPTPSVNDTPRGNIFDDIGNFFKKVFVNPCERVKCCSNSNSSRTIHC
jgi:hypothetical protein